MAFKVFFLLIAGIWGVGLVLHYVVRLVELRRGPEKPIVVSKPIPLEIEAERPPHPLDDGLILGRPIEEWDYTEIREEEGVYIRHKPDGTKVERPINPYEKMIFEINS